MTEANQTIFNNLKEYVYKQSSKIIEDILGKSSYDPIYAKDLIDRICEQVTFSFIKVVTKLANTNKNFKYITNCILLPKGGEGLDMGGLCSWDAEMDGTVTVKWDNEGIICVLNVYGIAV